MVKMYHHPKNEVSMLTGSKVIARTDTHTYTHRRTDRHDENIISTAYAGGNKQFKLKQQENCTIGGYIISKAPLERVMINILENVLNWLKLTSHVHNNSLEVLCSHVYIYYLFLIKLYSLRMQFGQNVMHLMYIPHELHQNFNRSTDKQYGYQDPSKPFLRQFIGVRIETEHVNIHKQYK